MMTFPAPPLRSIRYLTKPPPTHHHGPLIKEEEEHAHFYCINRQYIRMSAGNVIQKEQRVYVAYKEDVIMTLALQPTSTPQQS